MEQFRDAQHLVTVASVNVCQHVLLNERIDHKLLLGAILVVNRSGTERRLAVSMHLVGYLGELDDALPDRFGTICAILLSLAGDLVKLDLGRLWTRLLLLFFSFHTFS